MKIVARSRGAAVVGTNVKYLLNAIKGALVDVATTGALPIENQAKENCPVRTGTLRRSISTEVTESTATRAIASISPHTDYAGYVELGTIHQKAQPYMRPAYDEKRDEAAQVMTEMLREAVQQALIDASNTVASRRNR